MTIVRYAFFAMLFVMALAPFGAQAVIFEPGFEQETIASGFTLPTAMTHAPDGRIFIAEKSGVVRVVDNGVLLPTPVITLTDINDFGDRGLLGIEVDPDFLSNGYLYLSYTYENTPGFNYAGPKTGRIVRVTVTGNTASEASKVVLVGSVGGTAATPSCEDYPVTADCIPSDSSSHSVGGLRFGPDGKLYATLGDGAHFDFIDPKALRAQNLESLAGKVLRINADGTAPSDNPYYTGNSSDNKSKVYAYGARNMFRLNFHPTTGELFAGDVGWADWEEVNRIIPGANLGWPCWEGNGTTSYNCTASGVTLGTYVYAHNVAGAGSITVGDFPSGSAYPASYDNTMFIGDFAQNWIKLLELDANHNVIAERTFMDDPDGPVDITTGPDGTIYFLSIYTGELHRLTHTSGNRNPVVEMTGAPTSGLPPLSVTFSSVGSYDPDGDPFTYLWNFGDGNSSTTANPIHTYTATGSYQVTLTLADSFGAQASKNMTITVGDLAPQATILFPASGELYEPDDIIYFEGIGTDPEDGPLPPSALDWRVILHHNTHFHIEQTLLGVASSTFVAPDHNATDVYLEFELTVTDSAGLTDTTSVNMYLDNGAGAGNLIYNPSVEIPGAPGFPLGWNHYGAPGLTADFRYPVQGYDGDDAIEMEITNYTSGNAKWFFDPVNVTEGQTYLFSNQYQSNAYSIQVAVFTMNDQSTQYQFITGLPSNASWTKAENDIVVPLGAELMTVYHEMYENGILTTDDFSLTLASSTDTEPPTATITAPTQSSTVSGDTTISVDATDNVGVSLVRFYVDGGQIGLDTEAPYDYLWDTTGFADGVHTLTAEAVDAAGNATTSAPVNVTVDNAGTSTSNLILNPSVEILDPFVPNTPQDWFAGGYGINTVEFRYPVAGYDGADAVEFEITDYTDGNAKWYFRPIPVSPGEEYLFSNYYKADTYTIQVVQYELETGEFQYEFFAGAPATGAWTKLESTLTVPNGAINLTVFHEMYGEGTLTTDHFSLTLIQSASSSAPLAAPPLAASAASEPFEEFSTASSTASSTLEIEEGVASSTPEIESTASSTPPLEFTEVGTSTATTTLEIESSTTTEPLASSTPFIDGDAGTGTSTPEITDPLLDVASSEPFETGTSTDPLVATSTDLIGFPPDGDIDVGTTTSTTTPE